MVRCAGIIGAMPRSPRPRLWLRFWARLSRSAGREERIRAWHSLEAMTSATTTTARRAAAEDLYFWAERELQAVEATSADPLDGTRTDAITHLAFASVETGRTDEAERWGNELLALDQMDRARR